MEKAIERPSGEKRGEKLIDGDCTELTVVAAVDVDDADVRHSTGEAHVGDALAIGRQARAGDGDFALGQIAMVGAVPVHDRDALDRLRARSGRGDIGDAAVEMAGPLGHRR